MPRKPLTPEQAAEAKEKRRQYQKEYKRKQRAQADWVEPPKTDTRGYRNRAEYMREYRKRKAAEKADQND